MSDITNDPNETLRCIQAHTSKALELRNQGKEVEAWEIIESLDSRLPPALERHKKIQGLRVVE